MYTFMVLAKKKCILLWIISLVDMGKLETGEKIDGKERKGSDRSWPKGCQDAGWSSWCCRGKQEETWQIYVIVHDNYRSIKDDKWNMFFSFKKKKKEIWGLFTHTSVGKLKAWLQNVKPMRKDYMVYQMLICLGVKFFFFFFEVFLPIFIYEQEVLYYWEKKK